MHTEVPGKADVGLSVRLIFSFCTPISHIYTWEANENHGTMPALVFVG